MNPHLIKIIPLLFSYKKELTYVLSVFVGILLLPIFAVLVVTHTGIPAVSNELATVNLKTHQVEIRDPSGNVITTLDLATTWPVPGTVTLEFGESDLPYQVLHTGIDIANPNGKIGDPVTPFMKGKVISTDDLSWGYGKNVVIDHGNNITSLYGHLNEVKVKPHAEVGPGDVIGTEGSTGWSTGPHVHFEIRVYGVPVNPRTFVEGNPEL